MSQLQISPGVSAYSNRHLARQTSLASCYCVKNRLLPHTLKKPEPTWFGEPRYRPKHFF